MFNPYVEEPVKDLHPIGPPPSPAPGGALDGLLGKLGHLEKDDLLIGLLVYLLAKDGEQDGIWPLVAAALYLIL